MPKSQSLPRHGHFEAVYRIAYNQMNSISDIISRVHQDPHHYNVVEGVLLYHETSYCASNANSSLMINTQNSHVWSLGNPHTPEEMHFQICSSVNIWFAVIGSQVIRPFVHEKYMTSQ
jgi:hypothetical protein